jgi:rare lipoprotein A
MKKNIYFKPSAIVVSIYGLNGFRLGTTIFKKFMQPVYNRLVGRIFRAVIICFLTLLLVPKSALAQDSTPKNDKTKILYGTASYYSNKFQGRKTANGEIFDHKKMTAACNVLPLGTWIRVTNLKNKKSVIVKVNDRLHHKTKRIIDLTKAGALALNFVKSGLAKVKVEVLGKKKPPK